MKLKHNRCYAFVTDDGELCRSPDGEPWLCKTKKEADIYQSVMFKEAKVMRVRIEVDE